MLTQVALVTSGGRLLNFVAVWMGADNPLVKSIWFEFHMNWFPLGMGVLCQKYAFSASTQQAEEVCFGLVCFCMSAYINS